MLYSALFVLCARPLSHGRSRSQRMAFCYISWLATVVTIQRQHHCWPGNPICARRHQWAQNDTARLASNPAEPALLLAHRSSKTRLSSVSNLDHQWRPLSSHLLPKTITHGHSHRRKLACPSLQSRAHLASPSLIDSLGVQSAPAFL